ncbi:hypothetical protein EWB00_000844, partial [Schistosoma japonicum]
MTHDKLLTVLLHCLLEKNITIRPIAVNPFYQYAIRKNFLLNYVPKWVLFFTKNASLVGVNADLKQEGRPLM